MATNYDEIYSFSFKNKKEKEILDAFIKALKFSFKTISMDKKDEESPYDPEFVKMIKEAQKEMNEGKYTEIKTGADLKKFLGIDE